MKKFNIKQLKDGVVIKLVHCREEATTTKAIVLKKWEFEDPTIHHLLLYGDNNRIFEGIFCETGDSVFVPESIYVETQMKNPMKEDYVPVEEHVTIIPSLLKRMLTEEPKLVFYTLN